MTLLYVPHDKEAKALEVKGYKLEEADCQTIMQCKSKTEFLNHLKGLKLESITINPAIIAEDWKSCISLIKEYY